MKNTLFDDYENEWQKEWKDMPEYNNKIIDKPFIIATFKFRNQDDFDQFNALIKKYIYDNQKPFDGMQKKNEKSTWYPLNEKNSKYIYTDESEISDLYNK
jgi:hypothetical protein